MAMTIEEAIKHAINKGTDPNRPESQCKDDHRQLAIWLLELKSYREKSKQKKVTPLNLPAPVVIDGNGKLTKDYSTKDWFAKIQEEVTEAHAVAAVIDDCKHRRVVKTLQNIQVIDLTNSNVLDKKMIVKLDKPIHSFPCRCCGKTVEIFDTFDKRTVFCSVQCEKKYWRDATRHKDHGRGGNIGMSGAMSLDSLERYEKRSVDDDKPSIILIKSCAVCGKTFKAKSIRQKFCSRKCNRESYYETEAPKITPPKNTKPIRSFICKVCGKEVDIYEKKDQRHTYCSGKCYKRWKNVLRPQKQQRKRNRGRTDTQGMSKGMSLGSLIKREKRSLE